MLRLLAWPGPSKGWWNIQEGLRIMRKPSFSPRLRKTIWFLSALCGAAFVQTFTTGQEPGKVIPARAELSPLEQPIAWLQEGKRNYGVVKDYTCWLVSQERVKGELLERNIIK